MRPEPAPIEADDDSRPIDPVTARRLLATAAITIASFRWKLRDAGHPFREPPGVDRLIAEIDAMMHPEEQPRRRSWKLRPPPDPTPEALRAARGLGGLVK